ncbi:hypothetical protein [Haloprofundus salinisoli]|uniref:hypothetical protein n=1 Tax=Haloprofundus salinisoli TaxID=2876193 RepID=UPI001CCF21C0|nr:hypothetical protein [Haloprofundus salinisoli]
MTDSNSTPRTDRTDDSDGTDGTDGTDAPKTESPVSDDGANGTRTQHQNHRQSAGVSAHAANQRRAGDDEAAFRCRHCGDPFVEERHLALHRGLNHVDALSEAEREAYRDAHADEEADLKRFRLVSLGALVVLYFGFLFIYAVVT